MHRDLTVGKRTTLGFGVVLVLLTLTGGFAWRSVGEVGESTETTIAESEVLRALMQAEVDHLIDRLADSSKTLRIQEAAPILQNFIGQDVRLNHESKASSLDGSSVNLPTIAKPLPRRLADKPLGDPPGYSVRVACPASLLCINLTN